MEVNHDAMKQGQPVEGNIRNTMEYDPSSAPQIMDSSSTPQMGYRSGAVPDHYESYPEVMPPQGLTSPGYQATQQSGSYSNAPMSVEAEKTYYQPTYGVSQPPPPTPYSNANTLVPNADAHNAGVLYGKTGTELPPPTTHNAPPAEKKILGLKKKTFWIVLVIVILVIIGAVGGAVGGILGSKKSNNNSNSSSSESSGGNNNNGTSTNTGTNGGNNNNNGTSSGGSGGSGTSYTPFAITTGVRTLNLEYQQDQGSCNDPQNTDGSGLVNCYATSKYTVRVDGSVQNGYTLSSVDVDGSTFSNVRGTPPTTDDPNETGSAWVFQVSFTDNSSCSVSRITRYVFGVNDDTYAVGEVFTLRDQCLLANGITYATGTSCTCVGISTTAI